MAEIVDAHFEPNSEYEAIASRQWSLIPAVTRRSIDVTAAFNERCQQEEIGSKLYTDGDLKTCEHFLFFHSNHWPKESRIRRNGIMI